MRTTITVDDRLLEAAKQRALERGATLSAVIQDALRSALASEAEKGPAPPFRLITYRGDGPWPGVELDRTSALIEADDIAAFVHDKAK